MSDRDPAVETWAEALPTSARLRQALDDCARLTKDLTAEIIVCEIAKAEVKRLRAENESLSRQLTMRGHLYHLTDKGRAALAPKEPS